MKNIINSGCYTLPLHKHIKIWFSNNPNEFMPKKNIERLIKFRYNNPEDELTIIYNSDLLNQYSLIKLYIFCFIFKFNLKDFKGIKPNNDIEQRLYELANQEMKALGKGGNLAAASDIVRIMKCCVENLGIYSDFDSNIITNKNTPKEILINAPFIINIQSKPQTEKQVELKTMSYEFNNDFVYIADFNSELIQAVQLRIIHMYNEMKTNPFKLIGEKLLNSNPEIKELFNNQKNEFTWSYNSTYRNNLITFRYYLEKKIHEGKTFSDAYIASVIKFSGPHVWLSVLKDSLEKIESKMVYSISGYDETKEKFNSNYNQDLSWVPNKKLLNFAN